MRDQRPALKNEADLVAEMQLSMGHVKKEMLQNSVLPFVQNKKLSSQTCVPVHV